MATKCVCSEHKKYPQVSFNKIKTFIGQFSQLSYVYTLEKFLDSWQYLNMYTGMCVYRHMYVCILYTYNAHYMHM